MVKWFTWQFRLGIVLIILSAVMFSIKLYVFGNISETYYYIINGLAFLPLTILLWTLIVNQLMIVHSKREQKEKLNMVIGAFFSEVGTNLLVYFSDVDPNLNTIRNFLVVNDGWTKEEFKHVNEEIKKYRFTIEIKKVELSSLKEFLVGHRNFLVRLVENPILLEHNEFTEVLRAVFHLTEELEARKNLNNLPSPDILHLTGDMQRAYKLLVSQWLSYMKYLKEHYPYLYSLAMRQNPFDETATPIILK